MKRSSSFLDDNQIDAKRADSDFTATIEIINDSLESSPLKKALYSEEGKHQSVRVKGTLVVYDISLIPDYTGCIGSETHSLCSCAYSPVSGKTIIRNEEEETYTILNNNCESKVQNPNEPEIQDYIDEDKQWNYFQSNYPFELRETTTITFSKHNDRYKVMDWIVEMCRSFHFTSETEILAMCLYHSISSQKDTLNHQMVAATSIYIAGIILQYKKVHLLPSILSERSLHSFSSDDVIATMQGLSSIAIPLCYRTLLQTLQSIKASPILLFSSLYFMECALIYGNFDSLSVKLFCEICTTCGMEKIGEITDTQWYIQEDKLQTITRSPTEVIRHHCKALYTKYSSSRKQSVASL